MSRETATDAGIQPSEIGAKLRLHSDSRESAVTRASRFLVEARVRIVGADESSARAEVRGDHGIYRVEIRDGWATCTCAAQGDCAHLLAVLRVVAFPTTVTRRRTSR